MSWRLWRPRPISAYEAAIVRRLLEVGASSPPSPTLLASLDNLMVIEEGDGAFHNDSLDFGGLRGPNNDIIASGIGLMANDGPVELVLWRRGDAVTYLELEPFNGTRRPIRMPRLETIAPYPANREDENKDEEADDLAS